MWLEAFHRQVQAHPSKIALVSEHGAFTYQELWDRSVAAGRDAAGPRGRRVIVDTDPQATLEQIIGAWHAGQVPMPILATLPPAVVDPLKARAAQPVPLPRENDPADVEGLILTTSGSTGAPKQVVLPHRSITAMLHSLTTYFEPAPNAVLLVPGSLARILPLVTATLCGLAQGWRVVLFREGAPPTQIHQAFREHGVTHVHATPSFYRLFLEYWNKVPHLPQQFVSASGEVMSPPMVRRMREMFPNARFYMGFGATESGRVSIVNLADPQYSRGGVGLARSHYQVRIEPVDGVSAPIGELVVKGPAVMLGYLQDDGSYQGLYPDGFYPTGDLVEQEADGWLFFRGRKDGLIKVGGHRVNTYQTEAHIRALPGVSEARCIAQPHPILGHVLAADVEPLEGHTLTVDAILRACAGHLEPQQIPREVRIVKSIALTAAGKISRIAWP